MRKKLREWRKKGKGENEYKGRKRDYREICEKKKRKLNEEWERRVKEVRKKRGVENCE